MRAAGAAFGPCPHPTRIERERDGSRAGHWKAETADFRGKPTEAERRGSNLLGSNPTATATKKSKISAIFVWR